MFLSPASRQSRKRSYTAINLLDSISGSFNGSLTTFNLTLNGVAITPVNSNYLEVVLGGVQQPPTSGYTVSDSTITFSSAPATGETCFILWYKTTAPIGAPGIPGINGANAVFTRSIDILTPIAADTYTIYWTNSNITIAEVVLAISNTLATGWANTTIGWTSDLSQAVTTILLSNTANNTTGVHTTSFANATPTANSYIRLTINALSNCNEIHCTIRCA